MSENINDNQNTQSTGSVTTAPNMNYSNQQKPNIPPAYKPLSPWAYVGYNLLFNVPLIGFIMMVVFSFDDSNLNRRNYARSFFCAMIIGLVISLLIVLVIVAIFGVGILSFSTKTTGVSTSVNSIY